MGNGAHKIKKCKMKDEHKVSLKYPSEEDKIWNNKMATFNKNLKINHTCSVCKNEYLITKDQNFVGVDTVLLSKSDVTHRGVWSNSTRNTFLKVIKWYGSCPHCSYEEDLLFCESTNEEFEYSYSYPNSQ